MQQVVELIINFLDSHFDQVFIIIIIDFFPINCIIVLGFIWHIADSFWIFLGLYFAFEIMRSTLCNMKGSLCKVYFHNT